jgi:hypothetical protein
VHDLASGGAGRFLRSNTSPKKTVLATALSCSAFRFARHGSVRTHLIQWARRNARDAVVPRNRALHRFCWTSKACSSDHVPPPAGSSPVPRSINPAVFPVSALNRKPPWPSPRDRKLPEIGQEAGDFNLVPRSELLGFGKTLKIGGKHS